MKRLFIFFIIIILTSCFDKKQKKGVDDIKNTHGLYIDEVIEYINYYEKDTLLVRVDVSHYKETMIKEKETWHFEYDDNNQLISEKHFKNKGNLMELTFSKEFNSNILTIIEFYEEDTVKFDQYQYDNKQNLILHKSKFKSNRTCRDSKLFDYEYDIENKIVRMKRHDIIITKTGSTDRISNIQYKYEMSGDTLVKYEVMNGNLSSVEKTISTSEPKTIELYTFSLPEYKLDTYEKKNIIDEDNYLEIKNIIGTSVDSTCFQGGKKVKLVECYQEMYFMHTYEYDNMGYLKKETKYSKLNK